MAILLLIIITTTTIVNRTYDVDIEFNRRPVETINEVMERIAVCESGGQQFIDGEVIRGRINPHDIGKWQINELIWAEDIKTLNGGVDIYTLEGNTLFAKYLYNEFGYSPWYLSEHCWGDERNI